tara:strand:+ start:117 stop:1043 length:927 start_codon:yes stop_codon:yes gene_type:complete
MNLDSLFYVPEKSWYELQGWATIAYEEDKNEISGLMTAIPQEDGRYKLSDVEILKQENTGSNTTLDGDAVSEYKMKYAMKYKNKDMKFVWWHSHHTMDAFWSGTDLKEIDAWENDSFSLALVINLKEEYKFRVSVWKAGGLEINQHYDIPLSIERSAKTKVTDKMKTLYEELCDSPSTIVNSGYHWNRGTQMGINYNNRMLNTKEREERINLESAYSQTIEQLDNLNDAFMDSSLNLRQYKKELKKVNKTLRDKKLPFKAIIPDGNKNDIIQSLMTTMSDEMLEFEDEMVRSKCQESYTWGGWYGGYQ